MAEQLQLNVASFTQNLKMIFGVRRAVALLLFFHPAKSDRMQQERTMTTAKQVRELFPKERLRQRYGGRNRRATGWLTTTSCIRITHSMVIVASGVSGFRRNGSLTAAGRNAPAAGTTAIPIMPGRSTLLIGKRQIKKFGSLEGAYADVWKRLAKEYPWMKNLPGHVA